MGTNLTKCSVCYDVCFNKKVAPTTFYGSAESDQLVQKPHAPVPFSQIQESSEEGCLVCGFLVEALRQVSKHLTEDEREEGFLEWDIVSEDPHKRAWHFSGETIDFFTLPSKPPQSYLELRS